MLKASDEIGHKFAFDCMAVVIADLLQTGARPSRGVISSERGIVMYFVRDVAVFDALINVMLASVSENLLAPF